MARMKFLCDAERCIECNGCVTACKNEHEVPWGISRRRVVTLNDGKPGERSISVACMHCSDPPCMSVCPVNCIYQTEDGVVLHSKDLCIGCGYCAYACPFGAPQYPQAGNFGTRGKMDKCTFCAGGPEEDGSEAEFHKYGRNRLAEGKLPLCAEMCSTKALLAGDGDVVSQIYIERVAARGFGSGAWGWGTAYQDKPIPALAEVPAVSPPRAFPRVAQDKGQGVTPGAAAVAAGTIGALLGGGAVLASRLGKKPLEGDALDATHNAEAADKPS